MCGIVGVITRKNSSLHNTQALKLFEELLILSQSRGKDSSGLVTIGQDGFEVYKEPVDVRRFLKTSKARELLDQQKKSRNGFFALGHSRMETHGSFLEQTNNQPVVKGSSIVFHNGIVVNTPQLWSSLQSEKQKFDVDTEIFCSIFNENIVRERDSGILSAIKQCFETIEGNFSISTVFPDYDLCLLATNTGSLYLGQDEQRANVFCYASEKGFLASAIAAFSSTQPIKVRQLPAGHVLFFKPSSFEVLYEGPAETLKSFPVPTKRGAQPHVHEAKQKAQRPRFQNSSKHRVLDELIREGHEKATAGISTLRRCTRCILPESMPYIEFDADGVCSYCHRHNSRRPLGMEALLKAVEPFRKKNGEPECIVSFSGGRDSSYALHVVKKELGLQPVAFSYDWGMLTDLGRRNQARMTGKLGVEHILVAADIQKKRENIRKNLLAWLERPMLGLIPLFMAGDKHYFYHLAQVRKKMNIDLVIYADNALEKTDFKYGFAGVMNNAREKRTYDIGRMNSFRLLYFYGKEFLLNPGYMNSSLWDTFTAYWSSYFIPKNYCYIFHHLPWEEQQVERTLIDEYAWELAEDTQSSWRIGDGTAAFYNYAYYVAGGLTEHDTFRSNQIREGLITREKALELAAAGNLPRIESILWYCDTIGIDAEPAIRAINGMAKAYEFPRELLTVSTA